MKVKADSGFFFFLIIDVDFPRFGFGGKLKVLPFKVRREEGKKSRIYIKDDIFKLL